jgi:hypothetical protein
MSHELRRKVAAKWVGEAFGHHKGALHRALGVPQGDKIPVAKLRSAEAKGGKLGKRAQLALTARSFKH